jgi:hypothetical protein
VGAVALLEARSLGLRGNVAVEDQSVGSVLDEQPAACERRRHDLRALVSSESMTELPRTCWRIAAYVGRACSTQRCSACSILPWLIASPNTSRQSSSSRA